jgi:hypothetical protein
VRHREREFLSLPPPLLEGHGARFMSILQERNSSISADSVYQLA